MVLKKEVIWVLFFGILVLKFELVILVKVLIIKKDIKLNIYIVEGKII